MASHAIVVVLPSSKVKLLNMDIISAIPIGISNCNYVICTCRVYSCVATSCMPSCSIYFKNLYGQQKNLI